MRSLATKVQEYIARSRLLADGRHHVDTTARVTYRKIHITPNCSLTIEGGTMVDASIVSDRPGARYSIGPDTFIGASHIIAASSISIGAHVLISWGCWIVDHDSHSLDYRDRLEDVKRWRCGEKRWDNVAISPVTICDHAWIGFNSVILKGVTIGRGAVIGAGSIVTKTIPDYCVAAGNPARIIRQLIP